MRFGTGKGSTPPIGDYFESAYHNPVARWLIRYGGIPDLHTHLRLRPMLDFLPRLAATGDTLRVLEVGCGTGINLFEIGRRRPATGVGYDLDRRSVAKAEQLAREHFPGKFEFHCSDATTVSESRTYDCILYMDIIEHLREPALVVAAMDGSLRPGGHIVVSVPTPKYPRIFGREMHERIGHVIDGYNVESLTALMPQCYRLVYHRYTTGALASPLCFLYYRVLSRLPSRASLLTTFPLLFARACDWINGPGRSCSLFAVYRKNG